MERVFGSGALRYGDRRISDELYDELRKQTPTEELRELVNKDINDMKGKTDSALGEIITKKLEANHIVSMDKIASMEEFEKLTTEQQLQILNKLDNFIGG